MKLATTTIDFRNYTSDSLKAMEYIAKAGFKYIDYSFCVDYNNKVGFFGNDQNHLDKVMKKADELNVKLVQSHAPFKMLMFEEDWAPLMEDTIKCVKMCSKLNIPTLVVHTGYAHSLTKQQTFEKNKEFFAPILEVAEKEGVYILAENFNRMFMDGVYWIDNAGDLCEFVDYVNHPYLKAVWDTGHGNLQEMPQHEQLKILGDRVMALHVQDNRGDDDHHVAPFFGTLNLDSVMKGLIDIGYNGYFTFEADNFFLKQRRNFDGDNKLSIAPLELMIKAENLLYETGKAILNAYNCFEE